MLYCANCGGRVEAGTTGCARCWSHGTGGSPLVRSPAGAISGVPGLWRLAMAFLLLAIVVGAAGLEATDLALLSGGATVIAVAAWEEATKGDGDSPILSR